MSFDNPTNRGRALKIIEILGHVEKSAMSNRAEADEIAALMAPVIDRLRQLGAIHPAPTLPPLAHHEGSEDRPRAMHTAADTLRKGAAIGSAKARMADDAAEAAETPLRAAEVPGGRWAGDCNAPAWAIIRDAAASAPLPDLAAAMAVMATRMDDALHELKGAAA